MIQLKNKSAVVLALGVAFFCATSLAQQIVTTTVGLPAKFQIESNVLDAELKQCSIVVTKPNSATEIVILQAPHFKTDLSFTPSVQGTTIVSWKGESTLNGKVENLVLGGVKQLFNNIGELVTLKKLGQFIVSCPGSGTVKILAAQKVQPAIAPGAVTTYTPDSGSM